jgi:hypothetical protein
MKVPAPAISFESLQADIENLKAGQETFQKTLNVVRYGVVDLPYAGFNTGTDVLAVQHGLGYASSFIAFFISGSTYQPLPYWDYGAGGASPASIALVQNDDQQILFTWRHLISQPPNTMKIKYFIFQEPVLV